MIEQHLQQLPDMKDELDRAFGFLAEKRYNQTSDSLTGCTSLIQRKLQCGFNRAAMLLDMMVEQKWITDADHTGARRLLKPTTGIAE